MFCLCVFIVMKLRHKVYFIEFAALILQRAMEEGHPNLVLKWGQTMLEFLSRCALTFHLFTDLKGKKKTHFIFQL